VGNLGEGGHLKDASVDGRIILKWIFEKLDDSARIGSTCLRIGKGGWLS
jgi:hypothetical protein